MRFSDVHDEIPKASGPLLREISGRERESGRGKKTVDIIHPGLLRRAPAESMRSWPSFTQARYNY